MAHLTWVLTNECAARYSTWSTSSGHWLKATILHMSCARKIWPRMRANTWSWNRFTSSSSSWETGPTISRIKWSSCRLVHFKNRFIKPNRANLRTSAESRTSKMIWNKNKSRSASPWVPYSEQMTEYGQWLWSNIIWFCFIGNKRCSCWGRRRIRLLNEPTNSIIMIKKIKLIKEIVLIMI